MGGRIDNVDASTDYTLPDTLAPGQTLWVRNTSATGAIKITVPSGITGAGFNGRGSRTNLISGSEDVSAWASVSSGGPPPAVPVVSINQINGPNGELNQADRVDLGAIANANEYSIIYKSTNPPAANGTYTFSVWLRTVSGTGTTYVNSFLKGSSAPYTTRCDLTTEWHRYAVTGEDDTVVGLRYWYVGPDNRHPTQPQAQPALSIYVWGGQLELASAASEYIPTVGAPVTINDATQMILGFGKVACFVNNGGQFIHCRVF